jgi:hypothetical protein
VLARGGTAAGRVFARYALDQRSLALLRMLVGLGFAIDRLIHWPNVMEFYTDRGSYPRISTVVVSPYPSGFDLFDSIGSPIGVFLLYALTILAGFAVAAGYKTRLSTGCSWLLGISLYNRCPHINPASDAEVLLCLFFGFFMPWGAIWSIDHPGRPEPGNLKLILSAATIGWRIQVCALYMTASCTKTSFHWGNGSATLVALISDQWSSSLGRWLGGILLLHPQVGIQMTSSVVLAEFCLPFLLLTPVTGLQVISLVGLLCMHVGFGMCLHLEAFTPLAIACLAGFLPSVFWERFPGLSNWMGNLFRLFPFASKAEATELRPLGAASSAFVSWAVLGIVWSCSSSIGAAPVHLSQNGGEPWHELGLKESWGMFVPVPYQGGWYIFRGLTERGDWVNLEVDGSVDSLDMPRELDQTVPGSRQVLLYNSTFITAEGMKPVQEEMANNFRLRWESKHPGLLDRLRKLELYKFYREYDSEAGNYTRPEKKYSYSWPAQPIEPPLLREIPLPASPGLEGDPTT